jgi:alpha-tubulin suppressor-like RCC1 family protein
MCDETHGWIDTTGTLWLVGANNNGQLGMNDLVDRLTRVQPVFADQLTIASAISSYESGSGWTFAVNTAGRVWGCGTSLNGRLGNGDDSATDYPIFQQISVPRPVGTLTVNCETTDASAFALCTDGTFWAWGANSNGIMGAGMPLGNLSAQQVRAFV